MTFWRNDDVERYATRSQEPLKGGPTSVSEYFISIVGPECVSEPFCAVSDSF